MQLSLAVAAKGRCHPDEFLQSLLAEKLLDRPGVDIHIAHDEALTLATSESAANVHLHACASGTSILKLWGTAIARSEGEFIAVLDIHCPLQPGWFARAQAEIDKATVMFCGPVEPGWAIDDKRIIGYLTDYAPFQAPLDRHPDEVPGNNLVVKRNLLAASAALEESGFFKTFTVWRLAREHGLLPLSCNEMRVLYRKPFAVRRYLVRQYVHGRCFGATRHDHPGQPARMACLGFAPLLPWRRTWRVWKAVRKHPPLRAAFMRFFHLVFLFETAWSLGEFMGYAFGGRHSCDRLE